MKSIFKIISMVEMAITMTCLAVFTSIIFLGALFRVFGHPLNWSADIALFLFAWATFLGGDVAFREGKLVNISILIERLPIKLQKTIAILIYAIILVSLVSMVFYGIKLCPTTIHRSFNGVQGFSYIWVTLSIPVSFSLMCLTAVDRLIHILKSNDKDMISKM